MGVCQCCDMEHFRIEKAYIKAIRPAKNKYVHDEIDCSCGLPIENYSWMSYYPESLYHTEMEALVKLRDILRVHLSRIGKGIRKCEKEERDG